MNVTKYRFIDSNQTSASRTYRPGFPVNDVNPTRNHFSCVHFSSPPQWGGVVAVSSGIISASCLRLPQRLITLVVSALLPTTLTPPASTVRTTASCPAHRPGASLTESSTFLSSSKLVGGYSAVGERPHSPKRDNRNPFTALAAHAPSPPHRAGQNDPVSDTDNRCISITLASPCRRSGRTSIRKPIHDIR